MKFLIKLFLISASALWAENKSLSSELPQNETQQLAEKTNTVIENNDTLQCAPAITNTVSSEEAPSNTAETSEEETPLEDIRDLRPAVDLPVELWQIIILSCTILACLIALLYVLKKHRQHSQNISIIPPDPYHKALQGLEAALQLIQHIDQRPFATGITDAVRKYLADVFSLPAPECTTEEVLEQLPNVALLTEEVRGNITYLLQQCDLAKFTKLQFDQPSRLKLYHQAKEFIQSADKLIQLQNANTQEQ